MVFRLEIIGNSIHHKQMQSVGLTKDNELSSCFLKIDNKSVYSLRKIYFLELLTMGCMFIKLEKITFLNSTADLVHSNSE